MKRYLLGFSVLAFVSLNAPAATANMNKIEHELILDAQKIMGSFASNNSSIAASVGYNYTLMDWLQVGVQNATLGWTNIASVTATTWSFLAGFTANFPFETSLDDAWFLSVGAGINHVSVTGVGFSPFQLQVWAGKRVKIWEHFSWRPSAFWNMQSGLVAGASSTNSFGFNLLSFAGTF